MQLPQRLIFADVETTGLHSTDRIVSLGLIELDTRSIRDPQPRVSFTHLIFDPGKKSHPQAERVHGYDDWTLRHQDPFAAHADRLRPYFQDPSVVWAHNAAFDGAFCQREFAAVGHSISADLQCTMRLYRQKAPGQRYGLKAIADTLGLARTSERHSALEDAWLAMCVFLKLNGHDPLSMPDFVRSGPTNLVQAPPLDGPLPRRSRKVRKPETAPEVGSTDFADVIAASRGLATLMLFVAMADGEVAEGEWAALMKLVDETTSRLGKTLSVAQRHDVVASLLDPKSTFSIRRAAQEVLADSYSRENLAAWIREVTFADGSGSPAEHQAIETIMSTIREARNAVR
jgi:DNA polymerase-3 subunit epsilon